MSKDVQKLYLKVSNSIGDYRSIIGVRLSFVLTFFFSILMLAILSITIFYAQKSIIPKTVNIAVASVVSELKNFDHDLSVGNFNNLLPSFNAMFNKKVLDYIFITDDSQVLTYSSLPTDYRIDTSSGECKIKPVNENVKTNYAQPVYIQKGKYKIYFGFAPDEKASTILGSILFQVTIILIIFSLILTIAITYIVTNLILRPLRRLHSVAAKFSEGDLSDRVDGTCFTEINDLIRAYNTMADALQKLYSSLEAEVASRTKELKYAYSELQSAQAMMIHSEKMKSLGELVAGIMHEINNPINFIYGNLTHLDNYSKDLVQIVEEYTLHDGELTEESKTKIAKVKTDVDYEFILTDMPDLIRSCKEGADRAKNIIQDLKSFSRFEESAIANVNIEKEFDTCLTILYNKYKNRITVHKEFVENMPSIEAYGGQLNQVFMNILDNAISAIEAQGDIWIRGSFTNNNVRIEIEDNGQGMTEETKLKVFNPFFTTKPVGKGTGLGMSITYKVIKNHQGTIDIESQVGIGTKFIITLPINIDREVMIKQNQNQD